jgi:hypothetical protein
LSPVAVASSITAILVQVQLTAQGSQHELLPVLIAVLVLLAATCRPSQPEP